MCGIAASIGRSPAGRIAALTAALAHRGPDGMGTWAAPDGSVALGHARLAIMDPLPRSDQPFHRGPLCVVYNGELYNLRELRTQLEAIGETFTTTGDTEVVAAALARWGPRAFERFDGMFALVAFDQRDRSVLTARDRYGIKPLYWRTQQGQTDFASELRPLLGGLAPEVDSQAVREFLRYGAPISRTIDERVVEHPVGTYGRWTDTSIEFRSYAEHDETLDHGDHLGDPVTELRRSIIAHSHADRPMALFLSGGFDSTVILAGLREAGTRPLALTLDTGSNTEDLERAKRSARHYGVDHEVITLDPVSLSDHLHRFLDAMDQPGIDGFNTSLISAACTDAGYPVALSGLGGDEVLGGYRYYHLEGRLRRLQPLSQRLPEGARRRMTALGSPLLGTTEARLQQLLAAKSVVQRHQAFRALFSDDEVARLAGAAPAPATSWLVDPDTSPRHQLARLDASTYLRPTLLRDADIHSMAFGLELRVPLVDRRLRAAVFSTENPPDKRRIAEAWGDRYLIEKASEPKLTFRLPWKQWVGRIIEDRAETLSQRDPWQGLVDPAEARRVLQVADDPEPLRQWALVALAQWLETDNVAPEGNAARESEVAREATTA